MKTELTKLNIENEMDIVVAYRRAMQVSKFSGAKVADQTRFATAVSEICRNAMEYCNGGTIVFNIIVIKKGFYDLEAIVSDCGSGIKNLENILSRNLQTITGRGRGIAFSKKLVDDLKIQTGTKGTLVNLIMHVPESAVPINQLIIQGWIKTIKQKEPISAYEELKVRNMGLMELTEELKSEKQKTEKQLEEINDLNLRLQKTNDYLEEFTYTVSHDLKTPLTSLRLSLQLMEGTTDQESMVSYIQIISRASKRLEKTIEGLVEILDVQTKTYSLAKQINLELWFEEIKEGFALLTLSKNINISHNFLVKEINYLPQYLTSIFTNLITNSIKYRQPDIQLELTISSRRKNGFVILTFKDNAEGIDLTKNGNMLFAPFTRFNVEQEGKGIGLYIIKKMIEKNGGKIEVDSEVGVGTSFSIYLKEY
ncbi:MAG: hypothetical protein NVS3B19_14540 [Ginsengibacter sp.]